MGQRNRKSIREEETSESISVSGGRKADKEKIKDLKMKKKRWRRNLMN